MDVKAYLTRIQSDATAALALLPSAEPIRTSEDLVRACANGGTYSLAAGMYVGNFFATKPVRIVGPRDAVLVPADALTPTVRVMASASLFKGFSVKAGASDRECVVVGDFMATRVEDQPADVTLDTLEITAGSQGGRRGIALHGVSLTVQGCRVVGFWNRGQDAQAVWIHNGPGPYTVVDNYLEGSGENIMAGGEHIRIAGCIPSDLTIRGNTCYKPEAWRTNGATVKNSIELKNARHVLIENNLCDGNWRSGQAGAPIVLTVRNQYGDTPWVLVDDVILRGNTTRRCTEGAAVSILGSDNNYPSQQSQTMRFEHNLFSDSPIGFAIGNGVATALVIRNNTLPLVTVKFLDFNDTRSDGSHPPDLSKAVQTPLTFVENIVRAGAYGITGTDQTIGVPALNAYSDVVDWRGNVIEKSAERPGIAFPNPSENYLVECGALETILEPAPSYKLKPGQAYGNAGY